MPHTHKPSVSPGSVKARALRPGDTIGIVAPAGPITPDGLEQGIARLHAWGYRTLVGESVLDRRGYLAGTDTRRAADFNAMWANPDVAAVLCARGGYGVMRILEQLDWELIRRQPKFFCGFSDITALHVALEQEAGLITFHGPMAVAFGQAELYNGTGLKQALVQTMPLGPVPWPEPEQAAPGVPLPTVIRTGEVEGRLIGGNLTLLTGLMGTPWEPDFTGRIVVIEEVDEYPYKVDRMLTQLLLGGKLRHAAGILFGDSPSCMYGAEGKPSLTLMEVLEDRLGPLGIPVLYGFPCGHTEYRATLPLGAAARLDAGAVSLTMLEGALV
jgi:muramoyltetrapeptide carboxypeptidase